MYKLSHNTKSQKQLFYTSKQWQHTKTFEDQTGMNGWYSMNISVTKQIECYDFNIKIVWKLEVSIESIDYFKERLLWFTLTLCHTVRIDQTIILCELRFDSSQVCIIMRIMHTFDITRT